MISLARVSALLGVSDIVNIFTQTISYEPKAVLQVAASALRNRSAREEAWNLCSR